MNETFVTAEVYGGLGNQITQIALAIIIGKKINKPVKFLKNNTAVKGKIRNIKWNTLFSNCEGLNIEITNSRLINEKDMVNFFEECKNLSLENYNILLDGYFQNIKYFKEDKLYLRDFFMPYISSLGEVFLDKYNPEDKIAIHIRCFEASPLYGERCIDFYPTVPIAYYKSVLKTYKELEGKEILFFLDDVVLEENVRKYFGEDIAIVNEEEDFSFYILSKCKYIIRGNSTYSWWAGFLSDTVERIYVPSDEWIFKHNNHLKDMYCSNFIIHPL